MMPRSADDLTIGADPLLDLSSGSLEDVHDRERERRQRGHDVENLVRRHEPILRNETPEPKQRLHVGPVERHELLVGVRAARDAEARHVVIGDPDGFRRQLEVA